MSRFRTSSHAALSRLLPCQSRIFRVYTAKLMGDYVDIGGEDAIRHDVYDPTSYTGSQALGEQQRAAGLPGVLNDRVGYLGETNAIAFNPPSILDVTQTDNFEITVGVENQTIEARRLSS